MWSVLSASPDYNRRRETLTSLSSPTYCIEKLEFPWKHHTVAELNKLVELLHILEPLQVESQDQRQFLYSQSLGGLLFTAALLAIVLGLRTQSLVGTEHFEAVGE
jgi:hypothetical protein